MPLDGDSAVGQMTPSATGRQNRRHIGSVTEANLVEPARRAFPDDADTQAGSHQFSLPRFVDDRGTSVCRSPSHSRHRPPVAATNPHPPSCWCQGCRPAAGDLPRTHGLDPQQVSWSRNISPPVACISPLPRYTQGGQRARNSFQRIDALDYLFRVPRQSL